MRKKIGPASDFFKFVFRLIQQEARDLFEFRQLSRSRDAVKLSRDLNFRLESIKLASASLVGDVITVADFLNRVSDLKATREMCNNFNTAANAETADQMGMDLPSARALTPSPEIGVPSTSQRVRSTRSTTRSSPLQIGISSTSQSTRSRNNRGRRQNVGREIDVEPIRRNSLEDFDRPDQSTNVAAAVNVNLTRARGRGGRGRGRGGRRRGRGRRSAVNSIGVPSTSRNILDSANDFEQSSAVIPTAFPRECCVCMVRPVTHMLFSCGHVIICKECCIKLQVETYRKILNKYDSSPTVEPVFAIKCPLCRTITDKAVHIFF